MKKRKILLTSIIGILAIALILLISIQVKAKAQATQIVKDYSPTAKYKVGDVVKITPYDKNVRDRNLLCLEAQQHFTEETRYTVKAVINISGKVSTDQNGENPITDRYNAIMAYIAADSTRYSNVQNNAKQYAMWYSARTWLKQVGANYAGLTENFATYYGGGPDLSLDAKAYAYADSLTADELKIIDNTDENKVQKGVKKVKVEDKEYIKVGPFNLTFPGNLSEVTVYNQNNEAVSKVKYANKKDKENFEIINVGEIKSDKNFYILLPKNANITKMVKLYVKTNYEIKTAELTFFYSEKQSWQNLVRARGNTETTDKDKTIKYDIDFTGNLKVIKVDQNNKTKKLNGVEFIIKNVDKNKYVKRNDDGTIGWANEANASKFTTGEGNNKEGEILIENLPFGTYEAWETKNPNYGYEIVQNGKSQVVEINKTNELEVENKQTFVKIAGYVWEDIAANKENGRNNYYKTNIDGKHPDPYDQLIKGITVRLKDKAGNIVKNAKGNECIAHTDENGAYEFTDISVAELENYYVEFEYDGLTYASVETDINHSNGSKAKEIQSQREQLNSEFVSIEGTQDEAGDKGVSKDANGQIKHELTYNRDKNNYKSIFKHEEYYPICASTKEVYEISKNYVQGQERIENINLGLYKRTQPDIVLAQDIDNVKITVNGFGHIYDYANYKKNLDEYDGEGFNVGVKFEDKERLLRPIYKADYEFEDQENRKNELELYVTYELRIVNQAAELNVKANTIVDYYSKDYELIAIGTKLDEKYSNITSKYNEEDYTVDRDSNSNYNIITLSAKNQETDVIYLQFKLDRKTVIDIINNKNGGNLENIAEITSYSVKDKDGKPYAGVDIDSNPGNAIPGDKTTYEDDTDYARALQLEIEDARVMQGIVFEDVTESELQTGEMREADGEYKANEDKPIGGVEVTLKEKNSGLTYETTTATEDGTYGIKEENSTNNNNNSKVWELYKLNDNANSDNTYTVKAELKKGEFLIPGYIPGNYVLTYTWGNEEYKVENFKGTIYNDKDRMNNLTWYETEEPRYSDAIDDWEIRQNIDGENTEGTERMNSSTPEMKIGIEYKTLYTPSPEDGIQYGSTEAGNKVIYQIKNIDFGIVERARQEISLDKTVRTLKLSLANDQILVDATINDEGKLEGQIEGVTTEPAIENSLGFVKAELDKELWQGSNLEIGYDITAKNISEVDYVSEDYYKYGYEQAKNVCTSDKVLKLNITELRDYLDSTLAYDETNENTWKVETSDKEGKILLSTGALSKDLAPNDDSVTVELKASKILSNQENNIYNNEAKITKVVRTPEITTGKPYGRKPNLPEAQAQRVIISAPTGEDMNYVLPIIIGLSILIILGAGVVIIKKKVIK